MPRKDLQNINLITDTDHNVHIYPGHVNYGAGIPPYVRGNDSTMYIRKPFQNKPENKTILNIDDFQLSNSIQKNNLAVLLIMGLDLLIKKKDPAIEICFKWKFEEEFLTEIARMRAARVIWSILIKENHFEDYKSAKFQIFTQPHNELEALISILGGADFIHAKEDLKFFLQEESKITKTVDPLGGDYKLEDLTNEIIKKNMKLIQKITESGGLTDAIKEGILQK